MWQQISFVIGSVLGSGIFILPFSAAKYGFSGILGFLIVSTLFTFLSYLFSKVNSPFALIELHLGSTVSFFIGWSYWFISWVSTIVVLKEIVLYSSNIIPFIKGNEFIIESLLIVLFITINCLGSKNSNRIEFILSMIKMICLFLIPILCLWKGNGISIHISSSQVLQSLPIFIWCFVGVECASMISEKRNGIVIGMIIVSLIYLLNIVGIFYLLGYNVSQTAYVQALQKMSYNPYLLNIIIAVICIGTLNSWILASGMCALDCSKNGIFPSFLAKNNNYGSPYRAILISSVGLIPLSFLLRFKSNFDAINQFLNLSSGMFLLFYALFALAYYLDQQSIISLIICICCFIIFFSSGGIVYQLLIIALGLPLFIYRFIFFHGKKDY